MAQADDDLTETPSPEDTPEPVAADSAEERVPGSDPVRRWTLATLVVIIALLAWYVAADRFTPFTSQARVDAYVVPIAPQVQGNVLSIGVGNNQLVEQGDLLVQLDDSQYRLAVNKARADLETAEQAFGGVGRGGRFRGGRREGRAGGT